MKEIEEQVRFEIAEKWLKENGTLTTSQIVAKGKKERYKVTFKNKHDNKMQKIEGDDSKKLIIALYDSLS